MSCPPGLHSWSSAFSNLHQWYVWSLKVFRLLSFCWWYKHLFLSPKFEFYLKTLNEELLHLTDWCWANRLSIKIIKSSFMVFKPRQKRENLNIKLKINQRTIDRVKNSVFLGVILDENGNRTLLISQGKFQNPLV